MNVQNMITLFGRAVLGTVLLFIVLVVVNSTVIPAWNETILEINRIGWGHMTSAVRIILMAILVGTVVIYTTTSLWWKWGKPVKATHRNEHGEEHF